MPLFDIIVLSAIVAVFVTFGGVLGGLTWYCRGGLRQTQRHDSHGHGHDHGNWGVIIDD